MTKLFDTIKRRKTYSLEEDLFAYWSLYIDLQTVEVVAKILGRTSNSIRHRYLKKNNSLLKYIIKQAEQDNFGSDKHEDYYRFIYRYHKQQFVSIQDTKNIISDFAIPILEKKQNKVG